MAEQRVGRTNSSIRTQGTTEAPPETRHQQKPSPKPTGDSISSASNNECCLSKIWDAICNFFKCLFPCLFGHSTQKTQPDKNALAAKGSAFVLDNSERMKIRDNHTAIIDAFKKLEPDVQWHALYQWLITDLGLVNFAILATANQAIHTEICTGIKTDIANGTGLINLIVAANRAQPSDLPKVRQDLLKFLQNKLGIQDISTTSTPEPEPTAPETPPNTFAKFSKERQLMLLQGWTQNQVAMQQILPYLSKSHDDIQQAVLKTLSLESVDDFATLKEENRARLSVALLPPGSEKKAYDPAEGKTYEPRHDVRVKKTPPATVPHTEESTADASIEMPLITVPPIADPTDIVTNKFKQIADHGKKVEYFISDNCTAADRLTILQSVIWEETNATLILALLREWKNLNEDAPLLTATLQGLNEIRENEVTTAFRHKIRIPLEADILNSIARAASAKIKGYNTQA